MSKGKKSKIEPRVKFLGKGTFRFEEGTSEQMTVAWAAYPLDEATMRYQVRVLVAVGLAETPDHVVRDFWIDAVAMARIESKDWSSKVMEFARMAVADEAKRVADAADNLTVIRETSNRILH